MSYEIIEKLKKEISDFKPGADFEAVGEVTEYGDGIAKIGGLASALSQELLSIETDTGSVPALVFNLEENFIGAVVLSEATALKVGDRVKKTGRVMSLPVGEAIVGRVVDPLGAPLDGKGSIYGAGDKTEDYLLEKIAPSVVMRESVKTPLHTGIKAIDAMIPIGRGQRELIIGDRQTGKTAIALDAIINQKNDSGRPPVVCIYVAIGQKNSKVAQFVRTLEKNDALKYTIIVNAPASSPASLQYLAPFAGVAIGEYFMDQGRDVLVVYDDLSKHANAYRQLSLLLRRPPGREAYPGDVFYLHSRLLERAAKMSKEFGGGSLTALPIIETQLGDVSAYIPTNVISITDGQIYLESNLFFQGFRPAVNVGLSVSRVGSAAQTKAMKKVASQLRLELAQFRELQAFVQFASDLDQATKKKIERGQMLMEVLKQMDQEPIGFEKQVLILYAAINGHLDDIARDRLGEFEKEFIGNMDKLHGGVVEAIRQEGDISPDSEEKLKQAIADFKAIFLR
ncbi:MAG: F0F1 ATP synthase subunit alpha [Candidatus Vogelbacteria bacterium]|nr:F0F1 ATP synthase subunit alpha [Candidatus Vogelbacteria bacterium]